MACEDDFEARIRSLERRLAASEAEARQVQEHFRLFVEHAPAAVAMLDRELRYLLVSRRWLEDYDLGERDIIGLGHYEVFPEIPERWKEGHRRALAGEVLQAEEDSFVRADGRVEWLRWELLPWRGADGRIGGVIMLTEVITQRKNAESALLEGHRELERRVAERTRALEAAKNEADRANALKSRFLAAVNHDLRQPLYAAGAYLAVLARRAPQDPRLQELCGKTRQPLEAMAEILDALLDLSRLESGDITPKLRDFRVDEMLRKVVASHQPQAEEKGLRLDFVACPCTVHSDPALLTRVVDNFVSNAVRYTQKGEITVTCERREGFSLISVHDTGVGVPAEALEEIFDEYVQLDNAARDRRKGLGLGLSIARHVADALGHPLEAASVLGQGSTFAIRVPLADPIVEARPQPPGAEPSIGRRRPVVLIVDDDPMIGLSTRMLLEDEGFDAHEARDGDAALALVAEGLKPEAVISDYRLPGDDGVAVIRRLRAALGAQIPALLVTGDTSVPASSADAVLYKPVQPEALLARLRRSLPDGPR